MVCAHPRAGPCAIGTLELLSACARRLGARTRFSGGTGNSDCYLEACAKHDECFKRNGCSAAKSWPLTVEFAKKLVALEASKAVPVFGVFSIAWQWVNPPKPDPCVKCNLDVLAEFARCKAGKKGSGVNKYYCGNTGRYITIGPGGDYPDKDSADEACCTDKKTDASGYPTGYLPVLR